MREDKDEEEEAVCETAYNVAIYGNVCLGDGSMPQKDTPSMFITVRGRISRLLLF